MAQLTEGYACPVCKEPFYERLQALDQHLRDAHFLKRLDPNNKFELKSWHS